MISIHAPRVGRDHPDHYQPACPPPISIHAPRVGRDNRFIHNFLLILYFNPRAPCGARPVATRMDYALGDFNPRAPCGARLQSSCKLGSRFDFNPRAPCGARLARQRVVAGAVRISIHAPRVGRDPTSTASKTSARSFQSTRPVWGATARRTLSAVSAHFNPRAPCGARRHRLRTAAASKGFQSTRPVWGATVHGLHHAILVHISIHAPRVGRDLYCKLSWLPRVHFNPRAPCGARPQTAYA